MSATRKPAPSEVGAGRMRDTQSICPRCMGTGRYQRLPGTPKTQCFLCDGTGIFEAESGAPLQPGATPPEHDGVAHETETCTGPDTEARDCPVHSKDVKGRLYTQSDLDRMARLVVQEAAKNHVPAHRANECGLVTGYMICMCGRLKADGVTQWHTLWADHLRAEILSKAKLQQLREAVERP